MRAGARVLLQASSCLTGQEGGRIEWEGPESVTVSGCLRPPMRDKARNIGKVSSACRHKMAQGPGWGAPPRQSSFHISRNPDNFTRPGRAQPRLGARRWCVKTDVLPPQSFQMRCSCLLVAALHTVKLLALRRVRPVHRRVLHEGATPKLSRCIEPSRQTPPPPPSAVQLDCSDSCRVQRRLLLPWRLVDKHCGEFDAIRRDSCIPRSRITTPTFSRSRQSADVQRA